MHGATMTDTMRDCIVGRALARDICLLLVRFVSCGDEESVECSVLVVAI
jgi:hypothetical protein